MAEMIFCLRDVNLPKNIKSGLITVKFLIVRASAGLKVCKVFKQEDSRGSGRLIKDSPARE